MATGVFDVSLILLFAHFYKRNYTAAARQRKREEAMLAKNAKRYEEALKIVQGRGGGVDKKNE